MYPEALALAVEASQQATQALPDSPEVSPEVDRLLGLARSVIDSATELQRLTAESDREQVQPHVMFIVSVPLDAITTSCRKEFTPQF